MILATRQAAGGGCHGALTIDGCFGRKGSSITRVGRSVSGGPGSSVGHGLPSGCGEGRGSRGIVIVRSADGVGAMGGKDRASHHASRRKPAGAAS